MKLFTAVLALFVSFMTYALPHKIDLIFIVDNSASMSTFQKKLAREASYILNTLNGNAVDFRIGVVSSSLGQYFNGGQFIGNPAFLENKTPQLLNLLQQRILQGTSGSDLERGLESVTYAIQNNSSFIRPGAFLSLISISNEDDYSVGSTSRYEQFLNQLKGTPYLWNLNFIGINDLNSPCTTSGSYVEVGTRWINLALASKGVVGSICENDYSNLVDQILANIP